MTNFFQKRKYIFARAHIFFALTSKTGLIKHFEDKTLLVTSVILNFDINFCLLFLKFAGVEICTATSAMIAFAEYPGNWRARFLSNKRARDVFAVMRWNCFTQHPYFSWDYYINVETNYFD